MAKRKGINVQGVTGSMFDSLKKHDQNRRTLSTNSSDNCLRELIRLYWETYGERK